MFITANTLDDLLRSILSKLLKVKQRIRPTRGKATEIIGVLLKITNPRARLSRTETKGTLFSCLGELIWYLAKTNDLAFINHYLKDYKKYSDDGRTIYGAYGPRMFSMRGNNQVANVITLLRKRPYSRRAVIQLFDASDIITKRKDIPCTCTLQFIIRGGRLHMITNMRSNDAFIGLPHDVFAFTMFQEIVARTLRVKLGTYYHAVGSLHLYERHRDSARKYLKEGWQSTSMMPPMPVKNPWTSIRKLVAAECAIRCGKKVNIDTLGLDPYWADLVRLLQIYLHFKKGESSQIIQLKMKMSARLYDPYIEDKKQSVDTRAGKAFPVRSWSERAN